MWFWFCSFCFVLAGKTQVMGEIKVALKKEVKTEGDQLVLEILQCRNITYKFKSPDHLPGVEPISTDVHAFWFFNLNSPLFMNSYYYLSNLHPDLYVKLYVVNVATQKRIIKKKTRICRHDREPSFNETFRFPLNPTGHSIQVVYNRHLNNFQTPANCQIRWVNKT